MINVIKLERAATTLPQHGWQLLPIRFHRLDADSVVLTNLVGEHVFVTLDELAGVADGTCADQDLLARLRAAHLIQVPGETLPAELLAIKLRTRMRRLPDSTGLHIFAVTLRCEHTCRYCQVSRQSAAKSEFDMTEETARRALELAFRSPSPHLKIEFQGGEPLLNIPLVRWITAEAKRMNAGHGKDLAFVIATNLALLDDAGDRTFRLGNVHDSSYTDVMLSDGLLRPLTESIALSAPMCAMCAFEPYCGADPVFHHTTAGDFTGHKALSAFCRRNMGVFTLLLRKMRDDPYFRDLMRRWAR